MFLYVHKIRVEMLEKEPEREKQEEDLEEDFNDLVKQLIWTCIASIMAVR